MWRLLLQKIDLRLLDIGPMMPALKGVIMELEDCSWPNLVSLKATDDPIVAFKDCDVAVLVGAMPRREGMERKDLLKANAGIFKVQGQALDQVASKNVKVRKIIIESFFTLVRFRGRLLLWVIRQTQMHTLFPITRLPSPRPILPL